MTKDANLSDAELRTMYARHFSLGYIGSDINKKFAVVALIGYITMKIQKKRSETTHKQVIDRLTADMNLPEEFKTGLAIVCEDFAYGCKEFPTFGLKDKEMPAKIKEILKEYLPF